jgi:murein tripeptide amidase MpaA
MKLVTSLLLFIVLTQQVFSQTIPEKWLTYYEKSGYTKTPRYAETMEYCRQLEKASPWIKVMSFGKTPEGRDLMLVIASKDKAFDPKKAAKSGKAVILIQNGIHAGEIDGKDACLMLLRDIAITKTQASLLDHAIILIIPIFNVDGHERFGPFNRINQNGPEEMGWRVTGQNLNLNRDYMKADAPEMQAWLMLYNAWLPDFFVDCHVTDGADFQHVVTYGLETHSNIAAPVQSWLREKYLPTISTLKTNGATVVPYIFLRDEKDPLKGLIGGTAPPRFSTMYTTLHNRPGLLIETHMLKNYKQRVEGTYQLLQTTIKLVNDEAVSLRNAIHLADEQTVKGVDRPFPLQYETTEHPNQTVHYMGFNQHNEESDISGGTRIVYTKEPFEADVPRYDSIEITKSVEPPVAYLIPQQWQEVIARMKLHGLQLERLTTSIDTFIESYSFSNVKWQEHPFEGRHPVSYTVEKTKEKRTFPAGTVVVRMNQRAARVALHLLEPEAPDAFAAWGFFDAIFEQKEYAEDYVMETMSRDMIEHDPKLKVALEVKLRSDSVFAASPSQRLNFFYEHSPYWDYQVNLYPVARLMVNIPMQTEPLK